MTDVVLLTGITGFLGGHVALELLNAGYKVRGSLRNPGANGERETVVREALSRAGADISRLEFVTLDLTQDAGWDEAAKGVRFVMHTASPFVTTMPKDPQDLIVPAVEGTQRAISAAQKAGAERVILTSSCVTIINGRDPKNRPNTLGASDWSRPEDGRMNAYGISKTLAEQRAWELTKGTPELVVINPGFIVGPLLDNDPGTSGALFMRLLRGDVPMLPELYFHIVDVRDLAKIHVNAMKYREATGERHPSAFESLSLQNIAKIMAEELPQHTGKVPLRQAPNWLVRILSHFDGDIRANVNELGYAPRLDASAALKLLGQKPTPIRKSIADMSISIIEQGLVS